MSNAEATTTENTAAVAEQGATVAPVRRDELSDGNVPRAIRTCHTIASEGRFALTKLLLKSPTPH
jgi:hypothetical protein